MAEIVNLRMARKRKAREDRMRQADENRVRHGQTKAGRHAAETDARRQLATHEAHRRERTDGDDGA